MDRKKKNLKCSILMYIDMFRHAFPLCVYVHVDINILAPYLHVHTGTYRHTGTYIQTYPPPTYMYIHVCVYMRIHSHFLPPRYIHTPTYMYLYIYFYSYTEREREREGERGREREREGERERERARASERASRRACPQREETCQRTLAYVLKSADCASAAD